MKLRKFFSLLIFGSILITGLNGCKAKKQLRSDECNAFQASYISLPEGITYIGDVVATSENIVIYASMNGDDYTDSKSYLLWSDLDGNILKTQEISYIPKLFTDGSQVFVSYQETAIEMVVQEIGMDGPVNEGISIQTENFYDDFAVVNDTIAYVDDVGNIDFYRNGTKYYTRPTSTPGDISRKQLVVIDQKIAIFDSYTYEIVLINPSDSTEERIPVNQSQQRLSTGWSCESDFGMFFISNAELLVRVNMTDGVATEYLSFADTDIPPPSYGFGDQPDPIILDDTRLVYCYSGTESDSSEMILLKRLQENPHTGKTIITLGGGGVSYDPLIAHSVYYFNTSQEEYRIRLREYADIYPYEGPEEYQRVLATLISDMSSGNTDDILMGPVFFNFEIMGKSGAVVDMMPYVEKDSVVNADAWIPSVLNLMKTDDAMYRFFPGFSFLGYFGNSDFFGDNPTFSVSEMMQLGDELPDDVRLFPNASPENLFATAIIYDLDSYLDESGNFLITESQAQELLDYALRFGVYLSEEELMEVSLQDYMRGKEVLSFNYVWSAQNYREIEKLLDTETLFVGSPTLNGSAAICSPSTSLAISCASEYPDACWEFIKIMMSPEVQQKIIERGIFPVSQSAYDIYIDKAIHPELRTGAEEETFMTNDRSAVSVECTERLWGMIESLNVTNETDMLLIQIILEELAPALNGSKSAEDTAEVLNSRINVYLQTNNQVTS